SRTTTRTASPTCVAASPMPGAAYIVSARSSQRRAVGSSMFRTAPAGRLSKGSGYVRILRSAIARRWDPTLHADGIHINDETDRGTTERSFGATRAAGERTQPAHVGVAEEELPAMAAAHPLDRRRRGPEHGRLADAELDGLRSQAVAERPRSAL